MKKTAFIFQTILTLWLSLLVAGDASALSMVYRVQKGDSLWEIARRFQTSIQAIKRLNQLRSNEIYPGQQLRLGPSIREYAAPNGPYYGSKPRAPAQQSRTYLESAQSRPIEDYRRASDLLRAFDAEIGAKLEKVRRNNLSLNGWKIVIDPGHGGTDPGAVVTNIDGVKRSIYVVEDEYVHDIALRVYERLRLYGADAHLTVISPNHLIRENTQASVTFVNEQNETYNDEAYNRRNHIQVRPGSHNLSRRVQIANGFLKGAPKGKTLFISLHADNSPKRPRGPLVIYLNRKGKIDTRSRKFAQAMVSALNQTRIPCQIAGRNLAVLRNNRAYAEILVEIRNVHDKGEAWALRFHKNRQTDADRIVDGVLSYVRGR